jgi:hypothetical protein
MYKTSTATCPRVRKNHSTTLAYVQSLAPTTRHLPELGVAVRDSVLTKLQRVQVLGELFSVLGRVSVAERGGHHQEERLVFDIRDVVVGHAVDLGVESVPEDLDQFLGVAFGLPRLGGVKNGCFDPPREGSPEQL